MMDQAETLRRMLSDVDVKPSSHTHVIAVTSGKGGVGKTSVVSNLAILFGRAGKRVLAIDGDLGLANLDIALGIKSHGTIMDVLDGSVPIESILCYANESVAILPACSGRYELANLSDGDRYGLFSAIDSLEDDFDVVLIDTAAGIGPNAVSFSAAAQRVVLVVTSDPTSLADAYASIKVLSQRHGIKRVAIVANMVRTAAEGEDIHDRLSKLADRFLNIAVDYLGYIPRDGAMAKAMRTCTPVVLRDEHASSSQSLAQIAHRLLHDPAENISGGIQLFWKKVLGWKSK